MSKWPQISSEKQPKVIATIPCFNTECSIREIVSRAKQYVNQVTVIDDGSRDRTVEEAKAAGALIISHRVNRGYGAAIKSCFEAAKANDADILAILDGDGQHSPDNLPQVLAPVLNGEADLVIGSRFLTGEYNMPKYRRFGIRVITFLWNFRSKVKVSDAQSGFRAYSKRIFETFSLSERGMSVSIEILEKARRREAIIKEVPISCLYAPSALNPQAIRHGFGVALSAVRVRLKNYPTQEEQR